MILKGTTIACMDLNTGLVIKQIHTSMGDFLSRKIAVNNTYYRAEKERIKFSKPVLNSFVQTHILHYDRKKHKWRVSQDFEGTIFDSLDHAESLNRLFIPYYNLTEDLWEGLTLNQSENIALKSARLGMPCVTVPLPLSCTLEEWIALKLTLLERLNKSQELMPVLCLYHNPLSFAAIAEFEFRESPMLGIHYFSMLQAIPYTNLMCLYELNFGSAVGSEVPLIVAFGCPRYVNSLHSAATSYLLSLFGIDVISYQVMKPEQLLYVRDIPPEKFPFYDSNEGGYNNSDIQVVWYGRELTRSQLQEISADEGLAPWQAHYWANFLRETEDLDILNNRILGDGAFQLIEEKSRWSVSYSKLIRKD